MKFRCLQATIISALVYALIGYSETFANDHMVTLENFVTSSDDIAQSDVDLRIVMVHLESEQKVVVDIKAGEEKPIGNLKAGFWAVVMTRKIDNKPMYVGGGVAAVIFPKTLVALFNTGVDAASNE